MRFDYELDKEQLVLHFQKEVAQKLVEIETKVKLLDCKIMVKTWTNGMAVHVHVWGSNKMKGKFFLIKKTETILNAVAE